MKEQILGIQHIGIPTASLEKTLQFYKSIGFETVHETRNPQDGARVVFLRLAGLTIETWESDKACGTTGSIDHIALDVTDVDRVFAELEQNKSCRLLDAAPRFLPYWKHGLRFFTVEGPNGEKIEFSQYL